MTAAVLLLDRETAGHVAVALRVHRRVLERSGRPCPSALADLEQLAAQAARGIGGRTRTDGDASGKATYGHADGELLTQRRAADLLGVDPRTVRRWLDADDLRGVLVNGRRRIARRDLERLAAAETGEDS